MERKPVSLYSVVLPYCEAVNQFQQPRITYTAKDDNDNNNSPKYVNDTTKTHQKYINDNNNSPKHNNDNTITPTIL